MAAQDDTTAPGRRRRGRRGNREESIYLTTDGRWRGSILLPDGARKYLRGKTRAEVHQKIRRSLDDVDRTGKIATARQKVLLRDYLPAWLEEVRTGLRHSTWRVYEQHVRGHIIPALGHLRLEDLEPAHVSAMLNRSQVGGVSAATAQRIRATPRRALKSAVRAGHLTRNSAALAGAPKADAPTPHSLDAEQAERFLSAALGDPAGDFLAMLLLLDLRAGECQGLQWADVDEERSTLAIRRTVQRKDGG